MSAPADDKEQIGYKRPPRRTRWKKGQSGNPSKKRPRRLETDAEFIKRHLLSTFNHTTRDGETRKMTKIAGIVHQLVMEALKGSTPAFKVLQKYTAFAGQSTARTLSVKFEDSDYARELALGGDEEPSDDRT